MHKIFVQETLKVILVNLNWNKDLNSKVQTPFFVFLRTKNPITFKKFMWIKLQVPVRKKPLVAKAADSFEAITHFQAAIHHAKQGLLCRMGSSIWFLANETLLEDVEAIKRTVSILCMHRVCQSKKKQPPTPLHTGKKPFEFIKNLEKTTVFWNF